MVYIKLVKIMHCLSFCLTEIVIRNRIICVQKSEIIEKLKKNYQFFKLILNCLFEFGCKKKRKAVLLTFFTSTQIS